MNTVHMGVNNFLSSM